MHVESNVSFILKYSSIDCSIYILHFVKLCHLELIRGKGEGGKGGRSWLYAISSYHHNSHEFEPRSWQGVLDTTLRVKSLSVTCSNLVVFSTYKTDGHNITKILLKVALNIITMEMITVLDVECSYLRLNILFFLRLNNRKKFHFHITLNIRLTWVYSWW